MKWILLLLLAVPSAAQRARAPHHYRRHPNRATRWTAICRDGAVSFAQHRRGACNHHGGVKTWR